MAANCPFSGGVTSWFGANPQSSAPDAQQYPSPQCDSADLLPHSLLDGTDDVGFPLVPFNTPSATVCPQPSHFLPSPIHAPILLYIVRCHFFDAPTSFLRFRAPDQSLLRLGSMVPLIRSIWAVFTCGTACERRSREQTPSHTLRRQAFPDHTPSRGCNSATFLR